MIAYRIPSFNNREFYVAILAWEQIAYEQLIDAIGGLMIDG